jgi:ribosome-binding factor A
MPRIERVAELLKQKIAEILITKLNDHRIGFVSVTAVEVSKDLSVAKVFVSMMGTEDEKKRSFRGLISAIPFIRGTLSGAIDMRHVPKIKFIKDDSLEIGSNKINIINTLTAEREERERNAASENQTKA